MPPLLTQGMPSGSVVFLHCADFYRPLDALKFMIAIFDAMPYNRNSFIFLYRKDDKLHELQKNSARLLYRGHCASGDCEFCTPSFFDVSYSV